MSVSLPLSQFPAPRTRILPLLSKQLGGYSARCIMATVEDTSSLPGAGARETEMVGAAPNPLNAEHRSLSSNTSTAQPAVRYCENVGWDGSLALLSMLVVSGAQFYLAYSYSASFRSFHRGWSVVFLGFHAVYLLAVIYYLFRWRTLSQVYELDHQTNTTNKQPDQKKKCFPQLHTLYSLYKTTYIYQPNFLWKFYTTEVIGLVIQFVNFVTIYLCALPGWLNAMFALFLAAEAAYSAYITRQTWTPTIRDRMVKGDILLDVFDTVGPLVAMNAYKISIPLSTLVQVILWPSLTMLGKLRSMFLEIIRKRSSDKVVRARASSLSNKQTKDGGETDVHARLTAFARMPAIQKKSIPRNLRISLSSCMVIYSVCMTIVSIWSLVADQFGAVDCRAFSNGTFVWDRCIVKNPICADFFAPRCDCAVIEMDRHPFATLPPVIDSMTALRRVEITNGPLRQLSDGFGSQSKDLAMINMDFNELTALPDSFSNMLALHTVYMVFNEIETIPMGFWKLPELYWIDLSTNRIRESFEKAEMNLPNLHFLQIQNNTITTLPHHGWSNSPSLVIFEASGNRLNSLPREFSTLENLQYLYVARNNLSVSGMPAELAYLKQLKMLDIRNNSLVALPSWCKMIQTVYASGNKYCDGDHVESICRRQCSDYCTETELQAPGCANGCNSASCGYCI